MLKTKIAGKIGFWWNSRLITGMFFLMVSLFILGGALKYQVYRNSQFFAIYIDGQEVGLLAERETLGEILDTLQQEASSFYRQPVLLSGDKDVCYEKIYRPLAQEEPEKVRSELRNTLKYKIEALMVTVGGYDILPVSDKAAGENVLSIIANAYIPEKDDVSLADVRIMEEVDFRPVQCYPEELRDAETVAAILLRGTDRREIYLVSRGDSLWKIARDNNLSVEEIREANPQLRDDLLQIGDELSLIVPEPLINVVTVERILMTERIPFDTVYVSDETLWSGQTNVLEKGIFGSKEVTYEVTRENGREISREIVSLVVVSEPVVQKVARGTASIPSRGGKDFIWPVAGGGRLGSPYGWRSGGFHAGIDICAPRGTAVFAADSGTVVFAGRDGGYGNCIVLYHGNYYTRYGHNFENLVRQGQAVNRGDVIARVGSTGRSTGNHLHFEIRTGGIYGSSHDPLKFFQP